ncbi:hypothetical protein LINPERPRIM_LOCUS17143 [Linum perenne]
MQDDGSANPRCPRISFSPDEIRSFYKPWSKALVVKVLERSFAYPVIKRRLESLWARAGHIQVSDMTNAFFLVRFSDDDDYQRAIFGGPWKISVKRIGDHIGRTVRLDLATAEGARARYARVCVEIDLSKPLLELDCQPKAPENAGLTPEWVPLESATKEPEGDSGSWMTVTRRNRRGGTKPDPKPRDELPVGSRFIVLSQADSAKPEKAMKSSSEKVSPADKGIDPQVSEHVAKLSKVLQAAMNSQDLLGPSKTKKSSKLSSALIDVSNVKDVRKTHSSNSKVVADSMLVQVPITYGLPEFASNGAVDKTEAKPKKKQKENRLPP